MRSFGKSDGYYEPNNWKGKYAYPKKKEVFRWMCVECQNVQSGSQCQKCRKKWWDLKWEKAEEQGWKSTPHGEARAAKEDPQGMVQQLVQCLLNPLPGAAPTDPSTINMATQLQKRLLDTSSVQSKQQRLKSVIDKIDFQKKESCRKQETNSQTKDYKGTA